MRILSTMLTFCLYTRWDTNRRRLVHWVPLLGGAWRTLWRGGGMVRLWPAPWHAGSPAADAWASAWCLRCVLSCSSSPFPLVPLVAGLQLYTGCVWMRCTYGSSGDSVLACWPPLKGVRLSRRPGAVYLRRRLKGPDLRIGAPSVVA